MHHPVRSMCFVFLVDEGSSGESFWCFVFLGGCGGLFECFHVSCQLTRACHEMVDHEKQFNDDVDDQDLARFQISDIEAPSGGRRQLLRSGVKDQPVLNRELQSVGACSRRGYDIVEVSLIVDSSYCQGRSVDQVRADVQGIVAQASRFYEVDGLCKKFRISYLEINCDAFNDPVARFLRPAASRRDVCSTNSGLLAQFVMYVRSKNINADLNLLFHGTNFGTASIGCAYVNTVCNRLGYDSGVNYVGFSTNRINQAKLVVRTRKHFRRLYTYLLTHFRRLDRLTKLVTSWEPIILPQTVI